MSACGRRFVRCCWSEIVDRHRQSRKQQAEACMRLLDKRQEIGHACAETRADACKQESTHISRARARRSQSNSEKQDCCMLFLWPVGVQCNGFLLAWLGRGASCCVQAMPMAYWLCGRWLAAWGHENMAAGSVVGLGDDARTSNYQPPHIGRTEQHAPQRTKEI